MKYSGRKRRVVIKNGQKSWIISSFKTRKSREFGEKSYYSE